MVWFWRENFQDDSIPYAEYVYSGVENEIDPTEIVNYEGKLAAREDSPILELKGRNKKTVTEIGCLPTTTLCPLVNWPVRDVIAKLVPDNQVQFLPAHIIWRDEVISQYYFARPLIWRECIDLKKTLVIKWDRPYSLLGDYENLVLLESCMADEHFIRVELIKEILISDTLKTALDQLDDRSLLFVRPEDMIPWKRM
ncbi:MAG: hypothetical protein P1V13_14280 [Rhizobiaceae bacterium]|nr:hypothetical protein [Rhizobiaceae bacterium]